MKRFLACLAVCACARAHADGLSDLRAALARLGPHAPVKASLEVRSTDRRGEGKDADEKDGQAALSVEDGARGLQLTYGEDMLARIDAESRQLAKDPNAKTPTLWGVSHIDSVDVLHMVSAAQRLSHRLDECQFKGEVAEAWQGRPARRLTFSLPMSSVSASDRKYVKDFEGTIQVWIGADGTPLASREHAAVSGRAFVVVSFDSRADDELTYAVVGDRLVTTREDSRSISNGAGEHGEQRTVRTLLPLS